MTTRRTLLTTAATVLALSLESPGAAQASEPLRVVTTFTILEDMVANIGGDAIELTTLVGRDGDAHVYRPTPQAAAAVSQADVLVINGLEFEGWLERLIEASGFDGTLVVATTGIDPIAYDDEHDDHGDDDHDHDHDDHAEHDDHDHDHDDHADHDDHDHDHDDDADHDDHDHDHDDHASDDDHDHDDHADHDDHDDHAGHDHQHGAFDPHTWQSIENAVVYVNNITAGLAITDPESAGVFYGNRAAYVAELEALGEEIDALMSVVPVDRRTVVTPHDAFAYFGEEYGVTFLAPQGLSTESEASAADVAALITQIREEGINAVFIENITDNRLIEQIANETGAVVGGTLYSGALSDEDGPAPTYLDMMRHNATTIAEALGS